MKILVTGATGFIGSHVVPDLLAAGHQVRALARPTSDVSSLPAAVEVARGELHAPGDACAGVDGLVHLAGISGTMLRRGDPGDELRRVNVDGTHALFAAARAAGVRRGVLVTSMWTVLRPELAATSPYVRSRVESEQAALDASGASMATVILCPAFVVGAGDRGPNLPGAIVRDLSRGKMRVVPPGGSTWIAADDVARAVRAALERGEPGRRYPLGAEYLSYRDLGAAVAGMTGRRAPRWTAPWGLVRLGGRGADLALALVGKHAPIPMAIGVELLCQREPLDCADAWAALGTPRTRVLDAVQQAVTWFRAQEAS